MSTPVVMPQMGESIAEGTIVRWIKKVGDAVDRDEPLFEISTDKVDAEIPSPAAGVVLDISVKEGETVPVNSVVALIGEAGSAVAAPPTSRPEGPASAAPPPPLSEPSAPSAAPAVSAPSAPSAASASSAASAASVSPSASERQRSSPLVRRIAKEHKVDVAQIAGSGIGGRITKADILSFIERGPAAAPARAAAPAPAEAPALRAPVPAPHAPAVFRLPADRVEPMSVMRKKIAEHMVLSKHTSAHVYSVFEVNYSRVDQIRKAKKAEYEAAGAKLTFTSFIAKAAVDCLRRHPVINASIDGDNVIYRGTVNLGIAVALENGLIVPVVKGAEEKNILGLSRAIQDVADRARAKKLSPDEVQGGTFTITNPGNFGAQFGLPVINQPQVAILGVGTIEKRPVVIDDMIGIRTMGYLTLGYDHRLVDGAVADQFMADLKKSIEHFDPAQV
ncbi:MAG: 2-oxo acid dehydrogenase subunit E2 [Acidobacteria bacterium]|nr:2-oxo acid dehydrogenase subunit E2 [Acidobacteriota bacterium]